MTFDSFLPSPPDQQTLTCDLQQGLAILSEINALVQEGQLDQALQMSVGLIEQFPSWVEPVLTRAEILIALGQNAPAIDCLKKAIGLAPYYDPAYLRLARLYLANDSIQAAETVYEMLNERIAGMTDVNFAIGTCALRREDYGKAEHWLDRGLNCLIPARQMRCLPYGTVSLPRLRHDIEHLSWLESRDLIDLPYGALKAAYQAAIDRAPAHIDPSTLPQGAGNSQDIWALDRELLLALAPFYRRCLHLAPAGPISGQALSWPDGTTRRHQVEAYNEQRFLVIDDFLDSKALESLLSYALDSTIWHNDSQLGRNYIGAYEQSGFHPPIIDQIAGELTRCWPELFSGLPLEQVWAYRTVGGTKAIGAHADFAQVNVNFWITPDSANRKPESGGLRLYDCAAEEDWSFEEFNSNSDYIQNACKTARYITIPYRQNRAVIFDSRLIHESDEIQFGPDYEMMRTNVTMLFGRRNS